MAPHYMPNHRQTPIIGPSLWDPLWFYSALSLALAYLHITDTKVGKWSGWCFLPQGRQQIHLPGAKTECFHAMNPRWTLRNNSTPVLHCQNNSTLRDSLFFLNSLCFMSCPWWCSLRAFKLSWATGLLPLETCPAPVLTPWHLSISDYWSLLSDFLLATVLFLQLGPILTSV